jgi:hypothetical protein
MQRGCSDRGQQGTTVRDTGLTKEVGKLMAFKYKEISQGDDVVIMYTFRSHFEKPDTATNGFMLTII